MRVFLGMILGILLTIGVAFVHDTWTTGPSTTGANSPSSTVAHRTMVNWDVVDANWRTVRQRAREAWTTLSHKISS